MRIAIVEDNQKARQQLLDYLTCYEQKNHVGIITESFGNGLDIVDEYQEKRGRFDVIYFDVEMPLMDGMTAAKKIRALDSQVIIVFLTNYVQYAIDGYAVSATDFLLKPLTWFAFEQHFQKIVSRLRKRERAITVKTNRGLRRLLLDDIYYVESDGHYLHLYLTNGTTLDLLDSLRHFSEELADADFFRCHSGYLVNLKYVAAVKGNLVQINGCKIPISRSRKQAFLQTLTNYLGMQGAD